MSGNKHKDIEQLEATRDGQEAGQGGPAPAEAVVDEAKDSPHHEQEDATRVRVEDGDTGQGRPEAVVSRAKDSLHHMSAIQDGAKQGVDASGREDTRTSEWVKDARKSIERMDSRMEERSSREQHDLLNLSSQSISSHNTVAEDLQEMYVDDPRQLLRRTRLLVKSMTQIQKTLSYQASNSDPSRERTQLVYARVQSSIARIEMYSRVIEAVALEDKDLGGDFLELYSQLSVLETEYVVLESRLVEKPMSRDNEMGGGAQGGQLEIVDPLMQIKPLAQSEERDYDEVAVVRELPPVSNRFVTVRSKQQAATNAVQSSQSLGARPKTSVVTAQRQYPLMQDGRDLPSIGADVGENRETVGLEVIKSNTYGGQMLPLMVTAAEATQIVGSRSNVSAREETLQPTSMSTPANINTRRSVRFSAIDPPTQVSTPRLSRRSNLGFETTQLGPQPDISTYRDNAIYTRDTANQSLGSMYGGECLQYIPEQYDEENIDLKEAEATWRSFKLSTTDLGALSVMQVLKSIAGITNIELSGELGDVEITSLDNRERPRLEKLRASLKTECKDLSPQFTMVGEHAATAFKVATDWLDALDALVKKKNLHLKPENKHAEPLKLEKFAGHKDQRTNVYEFLKLYEVISRGFTQEHKGHYLYNNYLDDDVKSTVRHVRDDYTMMKKLLVVKFGDVNRLLSNKKNVIKSLPSVNFRSSEQQKVNYIKRFCEVMDQIQTLVDLNKSDFPAMSREIFSHTNVMDLSTLLPKFLYSKFTDAYVKKRNENDGEHVPGAESFNLLLNLLKENQCSLEFAIENYSLRHESMEKREEGKKFNLVSGACESKKSAARVLTSQPYHNKLIKAFCFVHEDFKRSIADCPMGKCPVFLKMRPCERLKWATKKKVCELCFLYRCKKRSPNKCFYADQMEQALVCFGCGAKGVERNVILCGEHKSDTKKVVEALKLFLPDFEDNTTVTMMQLIPALRVDPECVILRAEKDSPQMMKVQELRENPNAYDLTTGGIVPKQDVAHKTNKDSEDYAIYPMQTLNISGQRTLVLYDSGAMGEAVKAELAERVGMSVIDNRPQSFRVAGGGVVHTSNPLYEATLGPDTRGEYHTFSLLGMDKITEAVPAIDLGEMAQELASSHVSAPISKEITPAYTGGAEVQLIIGIRRSLLFPTRLFVLNSGLQVWRSQIADIYGSTIIFAGPHASVKQAYATLNMTNMDTFSLLFTSSYNLYRSNLGLIPMQGQICPERNNSKLKKGNPSHSYLTPLDSFDAESVIAEAGDSTRMEDEAMEAEDAKPATQSLPLTVLLKSFDLIEDDCDLDSLQQAVVAEHSAWVSIVEDMKLKVASIDDQISGTNPCSSWSGERERAASFLAASDSSPLANFEHCMCLERCIYNKTRVPRTLERHFQDEEEAGCTIDFRCSACAECPDCKKGARLRPVSIREEAEEALIEKSILTDFEAGVTRCVYSFVQKPEEYLPKKWGGAKSNYKIAENVLRAQRNKSKKVRESVLKFHAEIYESGFVATLKSLP